MATPIPRSVRRCLTGPAERFKVRVVAADGGLERSARAARVPLRKLARAQLVQGDGSRLLAVFPADRSLDLQALEKLFKRPFESCSRDEVGRHFEGCDADALPPFGTEFGIKTVVDDALGGLDEIFFQSGTRGHFIRTDGETFRGLMQEAWSGYSITEVPELGVAESMRQRVTEVRKLPPMPGIAVEILRLRNNPYSTATELTAIIEQDPSLAAQLLRYAGSAFYGYQGKLDTVEQAVVRVLGMDFVMDFAFGLSLGRSFRQTTDGPIGLSAFWRHSVHAAALTQALCNEIDYSRRPAAGVAYLAGLVHNFGFLLLGHLFPEQFEKLNRTLAEQPDRTVRDVEQELLGLTHAEIGLWLMEAWDMPREIAETVREHHNAEFRGGHAVYANLVCIANRLLRRHGMGDAETVDIPDDLLHEVGLSRERIELALAAVLDVGDGLDSMARSLAA